MPKDYGGKLNREAMMDAFDPNHEDLNEWATFIPRWRGAFQTHKSRSAALRAMSPRFIAFGILYRRFGSRWIEIERFDSRQAIPMNCYMCGMLRSQKQNMMLFNTDEYLERRWVKQHRRVVDPPHAAWMCRDCVRRNK